MEGKRTAQDLDVLVGDKVDRDSLAPEPVAQGTRISSHSHPNKAEQESAHRPDRPIL